PVALLVEGPPPPLSGVNLLGYAYLGIVGTAVGYWLWFRGISRIPATSVAFLTLLSPVSAAVIGWAALGQALTPLQLLGMVIALGGTLLGQTQRGSPSPPAREAVSGQSATAPAASAASARTRT